MGIFPTDDDKLNCIYAQEAAMVDAAECIAEALDGSRMTQSALARKLGVTRGEITHRLRGERNLSIRTLAATLHAAGYQLVIEARPIGESRVSAPTASHEERPSYGAHWALPAGAIDELVKIDHLSEPMTMKWTTTLLTGSHDLSTLIVRPADDREHA